MTINQHLENTIEELKAIITAKYPTATYPVRPFTHISNHYASNGNTQIGTYYQCDFSFTVCASESSHPSLRPSPTTVKLFIRYDENTQKRIIIRDFPIDSVDVNYCTLDKKINQRNITLGRKHNRQVVKWVSTQLPKKIEMTLELDAPSFKALQTKIGLYKENQSINWAASKIAREIVPSKEMQRLNRRRGTSRNVFETMAQYGFSREGNTFFHNGTKVGSKKNVSSYIRTHLDLFIDTFQTDYPYTAENNSKIVA